MCVVGRHPSNEPAAKILGAAIGKPDLRYVQLPARTPGAKESFKPAFEGSVPARA